MQNTHKKAKEDYVRLRPDKYIEFSSEGYLWEVLEKNAYVDVTFLGIPGLDRLPFCSAFVLKTGPGASGARFLAYSDAHRKVIESKEFADLAKPYVKWGIKKMKRGHEIGVHEIEVYLDDLSLHTPISDRLFKVHAPFEYNIIQKYLNPKRNETILEVGCLTGRLSMMLAKEVRKVVGIDRSRPYIKTAKKRAKNLGLRNCRFINARYPHDFSERFDYTIMFQVPFGGKEFRDHLFPSEEVLIGELFSSRTKEIEEVWKRKTESNFRKNYKIRLSQENFEEMGNNMYFIVAHLERR